MLRVIVTLNADGAVVRDADDCAHLRLATGLDRRELAVALRATGSGAPAEDGDVWLDLAVLRSRAELVASDPEWARHWTALVDDAGRRGALSGDGKAVRVRVEEEM